MTDLESRLRADLDFVRREAQSWRDNFGPCMQADAFEFVADVLSGTTTPIGRPKVHDEPRIATTVRLPVSLAQRLDETAHEREVGRNWLIVRLLTKGLDRLADTEDGPR